ncbi:MAG TPA: L-arabinose isomerase [Acidimicrobiia bacterium]
MIDPGGSELWFVTGSQLLYGDETLAMVADNSRQIVAGLNSSPHIPLNIVVKPVMSSGESIAAIVREANADRRCAGLILWMHTFSPARMWIRGLEELNKPYLHLHTQFARDLPWATIDMDYMNAHQAAHGDREFGYIASRLRSRRKIVAGHWSESRVAERIGTWARAAFAVADAADARIARFGDNMRSVAVTEGDKVEFQRVFGYDVEGYGLGELVTRIGQFADAEIDKLCGEYDDAYDVAPELRPGGDRRESLRDAAAIELGLRSLLEEGGFVAFTDTFENLDGLKQLPGIAAQRIMADGYGFGAEGDWKTAAMVRAMKVMAHGLEGGTTFMEDYTYHLDPDGSLTLGAHMLEVCPSIADGTPRCEIHPLSIGGKEDPVRLVFDAQAGPSVNASVVDLGNRFRMTVARVEVVAPPASTPALPVARSLWKPEPDLGSAAEAWILAGGSHHSSHSRALKVEHLEDLALILGVELVTIDAGTDLRELERELFWNDAAHRLMPR